MSRPWRPAAPEDACHRTAPRFLRYAEDDDDAPQGSNRFSPVGVGGGWLGGGEAGLLDEEASSSRPAQAAGGAVKLLMKNINGIKKKIKRYEEEFESAFGYRPSHSEKMKHREMKKYLGEP